ncbi:TolC family protein [Polynucleobacter sp. AP-Latsch-80-C2]|uniref:TolC family protein n=1 Tax=Polynucleobacter sp. AP-Latsch-80-C2 TaxID=2576931 RepID=UPI001C0CE775|nr:TolC family protein [Polynucleobacter sp. AP-Latsch-80-C2]MBU3622305.1 TolC family protein [Polynucleobacter sp. AP-Latsch-80-C2]
MLILSTYKTSAVNPLKSVAKLAILAFAASAATFPAFAQIGEIATTPVSGAVLVQIDQGNTLGMPPPIGAQTPVMDKNGKPLESLLPSTPANTPKIYTKSASSGPSEMDLRQLWTELKLNNPQLASLRESYLSAKATVPQIAAPANPQVGLVWSGMPPNSPLGLGGANAPTAQNPTGISSNNSISFAQPFQFPGKKSLASEIANTNAEALLAQSEATYLQLGAQLSSLFFNALASQKQLQVLRESVIRLEMIKNVAKARYSNNAAAYVEYLNAQVAQSAAQADQFNAERQLDVAIKSINTLVGRHAREKLVLRADVRRALSSVPTLVELEDYAESSHPSLKSSALQLEAARKGVTLAKKAYLPDFQVIGSSYTPRGPFAANNGAMFYQLELDLVIPLYFFTKEKYGVEQAQRNQAAAEASDISNRQQIVLAVNSAYASYQQAKTTANFLKDRQVPQADAAYKVGLVQYSNNGQGFNDLLTAQTQLRNLEVQLALAEANLLQAQAVLLVTAGKEPF